MHFITKYQKYFIIITISCIIGLIRWVFLDLNFPLFTLSNNQLKSLELKEVVTDNSENKSQYSFEKIDFDFIKKIVSNNDFSIIDARDFESYNECHIGMAYNIDSELLMEGDEEEKEKFNTVTTDIINKGNKKIILYCWNLDCDRAEYLKAGATIGGNLYSSGGTSILAS